MNSLVNKALSEAIMRKLLDKWLVLNSNAILTTTGEHVIANILTDFFAKFGTELAKKIPVCEVNLVNITYHALVFELKTVDLVDVTNLVWVMRPSTSCGVAGLRSRILKACGPSIFFQS